MKHIYAFLFAVIVATTTFAVPAGAQNLADETIFQIRPVRNATFDIIIEDFPQAVGRGQSLTGSITVVADASPTRRFLVGFEVLIDTPLGPAPVESGSFRIAGGTKRTFDVSIPVSANAQPGEYTLRVDVTVGNETVTAEHTFLVQ